MILPLFPGFRSPFSHVSATWCHSRWPICHLPLFLSPTCLLTKCLALDDPGRMVLPFSPMPPYVFRLWMAWPGWCHTCLPFVSHSSSLLVPRLSPTKAECSPGALVFPLSPHLSPIRFLPVSHFSYLWIILALAPALR